MRKTQVLLSILFTLLFSIYASVGWGQVSITNSSAVVENFTSFAGAASPSNWTVQGTGTGGTTWRGTTQTSGTSGGWYGNGNMSFLGSSTASAGNATWLLQNNTGSTITGFTLAFVGTLWKTGSASPSVTVTWSNSSSSTNPAQGALGNSLSSLTFNDATTNVATGASLTQSVSSLSIANGQYIFIRFIHPGGSNSDNLGWDDVTFTPTIQSTANYYNAANSDVTNVNNWWSNTDGATGSHPSNFTTASQVFNITHTGSTMSTGWTVSGTSSKVVLGDGTNAVSFSVPSGSALTGTVDVANAATLNISNTTIPTLGTLATTSSTVVYNAAGAQAVTAATYANLTISTTTANATAGGAIAASGTLTVSSGSTLDMGTANVLSGAFTPAGTGTIKTSVPTATSATPIPASKTWTGPVQYASASAQTVLAGTYTDLDISGGDRTLPSGTINISGTYTPGSGTLTVTGNTINFNGANGQTISAATYNTLTSTNNTRTLANGTIKIAGTFTPGSSNYTIGTSTVEFNGASAQSIPVLAVASGANYYNLTYSGSNVGTLAGSMTVGNNVTVAGAATANGIAITASTSKTLTINGNLVLTSGTLDWAGTNATASGNISLLGSITQTSGITFTTASVANGTITFNGSGTISSPQAITLSSFNTFQYTNITVNTGTVVQVNNSFSLTGSPTANYIGTLTVNGTLNLLTNAITGTATAAAFTLNSGGTLITANTAGIAGSIPTSTSMTRTFAAGANYTFNGATTTAFPTAAQQASFGNPASINVNANITLNRDITATGTLSLTSGTLTVGTNTFTINGTTINRDGSSYTGNIDASNASTTLAFTNTSGLTVPASSITGSIKNLTMNGAGGITIGSDITVAGTLAFTSGKITTGSNKVIISSTGSISRTSGHVIGNLQKNIATGATSKTFEIGDASNYTPASVVFGNVTVTGDLTASTTVPGAPPATASAIHPTKYLNRYWTLTNSGITFTTYSSTFTFVAGDIQGSASTSNFIGAKNSSGTWSNPTVGTKTSTSTQLTGLTSFSDFYLGEPGTPSVTTNAANSITATGAVLNGTVNDNGTTTTPGFDYGLTASYGSTATTSPSSITSGTGSTATSATLSSLSVNTQYHFRANGTNSIGTSNGSDASFYTLANTPGAPTVNNPTNTTLDVTIDANGNPSTTPFAIHETTTGNYVQANGSLSGSAVWQTAATWGTKTVTGLSGGTQYTFEVKARNGANVPVETAFGTSANGTTTSSVAPTITTPTATSITNTTATLGGNVTSDGGATISARGVVWAATSDNNDPQLSGTGVTDVAGTGTTGVFTVSATSLPVATQISYKAYATNSQGTTYTSASSFYTLANEPTTQATTVSFANPTSSSLDISWTSGNGGRRAVFMKETSAGTITNPSDATAYTASNDWSSKGTQSGTSGYYCIYNGTSNTVSVSNLSAATNYYVQVFEYNSDGSVTAATINYFTSTGTGNPGSSITLSTEPSAHTTTFNANAASTTSITLDFNGASTITNAAGYIILQKQGSAAPTSNPSDATAYSVGNTIGDGTVAAIITNTATTSTTISSLSYATQYSFKIIPYNWNASSSSTYNYYTGGTIPSATTSTSTPTAPSLNTPTSASITTTTATLGGNITADGGDPITERGIVWSETSLETNPTIGATNVTKVAGSGTSTGSFTVSTTGLTSGVSITYRAYAINSTGTGYTTAKTITTLAAQPSTAATTMTFSNTTVSSIQVSWTNGNGANRIVVARPNATTSRVAPTNATAYAVNSASIADGANVTTGTGNVVVYNGSGNSVTVTGLSVNTVYAFDVYEYNGTGASANYSANLTSTKSTLTTEPTVQASNITFSGISSTGFTINWTKGTGSDNSLIIVKDGGAVSATPVDGTSYSASVSNVFGTGSEIGTGTGNYVVYRAAASTIAVTGLTDGHTYYVAVYAYNGSSGGGLENYLTTSPATGSQTAQLPTYYSLNSGDPQTLSNWNTDSSGSGSAPGSLTANAGIFVIRNGHTMTTTASFSFGTTNSKLKIAFGGILSAGHTITIASGATFQIDNGGKYQQNAAVNMTSTIFNGTEAFAPNSTVEYTVNPGGATAPAGSGYGNLIINVTTGSTAFGWGGSITSVQGDLTILGTGTGTTRHAFTAGSDITVNIGGKLIVTGGNFWFSSAAGKTIVNLNGDLNVNGGLLDLANSSGIDTLNIAGSINITSGTLKANTGVSLVNFTGTNKSFTQTGGTLTNTNINWKVSSGASLSLANNLPVATSRSVAVDGTLSCGINTVSGAGALTVNSGGTLKVGSTNAGGAIAGNVTTSGTFTLNSGSTVEYNGTGAQFMQARTFPNLTINNTNGVTMLGDVTVSSGLNLSSGALSIASNTLTLTGAVTGSGTLTGGTTSNLAINGSAGTLNFTSGSNSLHNFTLGNAASATLGTALNITSAFGLLTLGTSATLNTGGFLTLKSNSFGTAKVAAIPSSAIINGNVTVERYIPNKGSRKYSFLSSAISQSIASSWQQQIHITGPGTGGTSCQSASGQPTANSNGFDASGVNTSSMFFYNPNATTKWTTIANTNATSLTPGVGYRVLVRGTRAQGCALLFSNPPIPDSVTLSATGTLTQGNVDVTVAGASGFTLLGNPYPADLDLSQFIADNSGVLANNFWVYSPQKNSGAYSAYNLNNSTPTNFPPGVTNHTIIAPGQAFFIQTKASPSGSTVQFRETQKAGTFQPGMFKNGVDMDRIRVSLYDTSSATNSIDEAVVDYNDGGSQSYDADWDARSMNSGKMIASQKAGEKLAIQSRPTMTSGSKDTIALFVDGTVASYTFGFTEHDQFMGSVYLLDKYNNTLQDIKANPNYTFSITADTNTKGLNRFALVFKALPCTVKIKNVGANTVCEPNAVQFAIDSNAATYSNAELQWNLNGSPIGGANDSVYSVTAIGGGNISLTATWPGCTTTSNSKTSYIKPKPNAIFTLSGPSVFCAGGSVTLYAPTVTGCNYTWLNNGTSMGTGNLKIIKAAGNYTVVAKLNGCTDTSNTAAIVQVNPLPIAGISAVSSTTFCSGDVCNMNATPTGGISYNWVIGTTTINTGADWNYATHIAGKYKVIVTDNNGCTGKVSASSISTKVNPIPNATINAVGSTSISSTGNVKLNAMPSSGVSWQWLKDGNPIANATSKQYIATSAGNYSVAITKTGCTGISTTTVVTQSTAKEESNNVTGSFIMSAYPNPIGDELTVTISGIENATNAKIEIMNSIGQSIVVKELSSMANCQLSTINWASGIYFVRYKDNEGRTGTIKIVKE